jgi:hypothetical protein
MAYRQAGLQAGSQADRQASRLVAAWWKNEHGEYSKKPNLHPTPWSKYTNFNTLQGSTAIPPRVYSHADIFNI